MDMIQYYKQNLNPKHFRFNIYRPAAIEYGTLSVEMVTKLRTDNFAHPLLCISAC